MQAQKTLDVMMLIKELKIPYELFEQWSEANLGRFRSQNLSVQTGFASETLCPASEYGLEK